MSKPKPYPRVMRETFVVIVPTNTAKSMGAWVQLANWPDEFKTTRTRITAIFNVGGVPGAGSFFVRPSRYAGPTAGLQGQPFQGAAQAFCGFAEILANSADSFPQVFSVEVEGFAELFLDNQLDVDVLGLRLQVETIATPTSEVGS